MSNSNLVQGEQVHEIYIRRSNPDEIHPENSYLKLSDGGLTLCNPLDTIQWIVEQTKADIDENGEITSILIQGDAISNFFIASTQKENEFFKKWTGKVRRDLQPGDVSKYTIYWSQKGNVYCFDPKIQINP
jgi:hypothetical protein